jgi:putative ABC transport system substrate-binding protein
MFVTPSPVSSQQVPAAARIGWLAQGDTMPRHFFEEALARLGWIEGRNLTIERRFAGSAGERIAVDAAELVAVHPDGIVAMGGSDALPILALTRTIPIGIVVVGDPIGQGLRKALLPPEEKSPRFYICARARQGLRRNSPAGRGLYVAMEPLQPFGI